MKKLLIGLVLASSLTGCRTMMTEQQHEIFAEDHALLAGCVSQGMLDPNLAAQGRYLYGIRRNRIYRVDDDLLDQKLVQFISRNGEYVTPQQCNMYAVKLRSEILSYNEAQESYEELQRTLQQTRPIKPNWTFCNSYNSGYGMFSTNCTAY